MKNEHHELLQRLEDYTPDEATAFPFSQRLARENSWPLPYARRVIHEYKRFAFLAVAAGHPVTPSDEVDQAWHLHMLHTGSNWKDFCGEVLRQPLHHQPTKGGANERDKFHDRYQRTIESYRQFFNEEPPVDIWSEPNKGQFFIMSTFGRISAADRVAVNMKNRPLCDPRSSELPGAYASSTVGVVTVLFGMLIV